MSNSALVNHIRLSPNRSRRTHKIDKITIHHMAGNLSVEVCGRVFSTSERAASSNYGIGSDGRVGMYVEELDRSWCSSNTENDDRAVTIEVANDVIGGDWHVSDAALEKLIELCADICRRNGIKALNFTGDKSGNLTQHNFFAATLCPGPYLKSKFPHIAEQVNLRLNATTSAVVPQDGVSPTAATCTISLPIVKHGSTGHAVRTVQVLLALWGEKLPLFGADSDFGDETEKAVKSFQEKRGLVSDGVVNAQTWLKLIGG